VFFKSKRWKCKVFSIQNLIYKLHYIFNNLIDFWLNTDINPELPPNDQKLEDNPNQIERIKYLTGYVNSVHAKVRNILFIKLFCLIFICRFQVSKETRALESIEYLLRNKLSWFLMILSHSSPFYKRRFTVQEGDPALVTSMTPSMAKLVGRNSIAN